MHCWWWCAWNPANHVGCSWKSHLWGGAGFQPSTVSLNHVHKPVVPGASFIAPNQVSIKNPVDLYSSKARNPYPSFFAGGIISEADDFRIPIIHPSGVGLERKLCISTIVAGSGAQRSIGELQLLGGRGDLFFMQGCRYESTQTSHLRWYVGRREWLWVRTKSATPCFSWRVVVVGLLLLLLLLFWWGGGSVDGCGIENF